MTLRRHQATRNRQTWSPVSATHSQRLGVRTIGIAILGAASLAGCGTAAEDHGALRVSCDATSPPGITMIRVVLDDEAREAGGRILVRADSLASRAGPVFEAPAGFLVQAFAAVGPGYGCATISPVGAWIRGPGLSLQRAWIHVKSDLPVHITAESRDGRVLAEAAADPGETIDPLTWAAGS